MLSRKGVIAVAIFVMIGGAVGGSSLAPSYSDCAKEQEASAGQDKQSNANYQLGTFFFCEGVFAEKNNGAITAVATIFLAIITYLLVALGRDQSKTTRRQLRAYVSATPLELSAAEENGTLVLVFHVHLRNTGQTPAFELTGFGDSSIGPCPLTKELKFDDSKDRDKGPRFVVFPHSEHLIAPRKILSPGEFALLNQGGMALYVFGKVRFIDAFGREQWTEYCAFLKQPEFGNDVARAKASETKSTHAAYRFTRYNNRASFD